MIVLILVIILLVCIIKKAPKEKHTDSKEQLKPHTYNEKSRQVRDVEGGTAEPATNTVQQPDEPDAESEPTESRNSGRTSRVMQRSIPVNQPVEKPEQVQANGSVHPPIDNTENNQISTSAPSGNATKSTKSKQQTSSKVAETSAGSQKLFEKPPSRDSVRSNQSTTSRQSNKSVKRTSVSQESNKSVSINLPDVEEDRPQKTLQKTNQRTLQKSRTSLPVIKVKSKQDNKNEIFEKQPGSIIISPREEQLAPIHEKPTLKRSTSEVQPKHDDDDQKMPEIFMRNYLISKVVNSEKSAAIDYQLRTSDDYQAWNDSLGSANSNSSSAQKEGSPPQSSPPMSNASTADSTSAYISENADNDRRRRQQRAVTSTRPRGSSTAKTGASKIYKSQV